MGLNNTKYDAVRYSFYHESIGNVIIEEPIGYNDDDLEYARNDEYHGIFTLFSNNLEFYGDSKDIIKNIYDTYGVETKLELKKEVLEQDAAQTNTMLWVEEYNSFADLTTYFEEKSKISCKFNSSGLATLFKTQEDIEVELEREFSLNGNTITQVPLNEFEIVPRDILSLSESIINGTQIFSLEGNSSPLTIVTSSKNDDFSDVDESPFSAVSGNFFWNQNQANSTALRINVDLRGSAIKTSSIISSDSPEEFESKFEIHKYNWNGTNYDFITKYDIATLVANGNYEKFNKTVDISLVLNDSLGFIHINDKTTTTVNTFDLSISDVSQYTTTFSQRNFVFIYDLLNKMTSIISGKNNKFKSNYFGVGGVGELTGLTNGMWIRGFHSFSKLYKSPNLSWKDIVSSLDAVFNIGFGIHKVGAKEMAIIEDKKYFFQDTIAHSSTDNVSELTKEVNPNMLFSELEFGYSAGGKYDEDMGLDEPNVKNKYATFIKNNKKKYSKISKVRTDSYGKEYARRKNQHGFPTVDTTYDYANWFLDIKVNGDSYTEKLWADRFDEAPEGVYSVETLTNAYFSPANNLLRHSSYFSSGFEKNLDESVRFTSSNGNSNLVTKLTGGNRLEESGNILNYNLDRPRFLPSIYKFTHVVTKEIRDKLKGYITINGESVPNTYCLWEFFDEGVSIKGYIKSVKLNSNQWEIIPFNEQTRRGNASQLVVNGVANIYTRTSLSSTIVDSTVNVAPIIGTLSYGSNTNTQVTVNWTVATDTNLAGYKVYYKLSSGTTWILFSTLGLVTTETITGLTETTSYDFSIIAYDSDTPVLSSPRSNIVTQETTDLTAPIIGVLSKSSESDSSIAVNWTAATDNIAVTGYKLHYKLSSVGTWTIIDTANTILSHTVTGLTANTSYDFKLKAYDLATNESSFSNVVTDLTLLSGDSWNSEFSSGANSTDTGACAGTAPYKYWNTTGLLVVNDYVYTSNNLGSALVGGNYWYKVGDGVFKINNTGKITESYACVTEIQ